MARQLINIPRTLAGQRQVVRDFGTCLNTGNFAGSVNCGTINMSVAKATIAAWVNVGNFQASSPFISTVAGIETTSTNSILLRIGDIAISNNQIEFAVSNGVQSKVSSNTKLQRGIWYHLAGVYDGANMLIYINGVLDNSGALTGTIAANGTFYISLSNNGAGRQFNGLLDDVRLYSRALSGSEVALLAANIEPSNTSLTGFWKFDEGSGTTATDSSGNGHTGTISSSTYSTNVVMKSRTVAS